MATTGKGVGGRRWTLYHLHARNDIERMNGTARRRYLQHRLNEIDHLIETVLYQRVGDEYPVFSASDMSDGSSQVWEEILHLNYLEASRQAILQALADLNKPGYSS